MDCSVADQLDDLHVFGSQCFDLRPPFFITGKDRILHGVKDNDVRFVPQVGTDGIVVPIIRRIKNLSLVEVIEGADFGL